ncbi:50S ribosomal protein L13 [Candidatus Micrarchaeota archaeon]|nr:50S ribosomal protein L13 [Candidatus Micrarchaeota archaeon]
MMIIVDGPGMILGRLASNIAKKLMEGEEVHLINCEKIVISGDPEVTIERYTQRRRLQHKGTPEFSPKWPKIPNLLVRRMIRGMLPFKKDKGRTAFKKLKVYVGNPEIKGKPTIFENAKAVELKRSMSVGALCRRLGANW